jgi:uncharacterized cupin superfamily protein
MGKNLQDQLTQGTHFAAAHAGDLAGLFDYMFEVGPYKFPGKVFLKEALGLTGMEVSFGKMPPGSQVPYSHKHTENEELYLFIKGQGEMFVDGEVIPVREGSAVRVGCEGARCWRNNSTEDLYYIVVQAKEGTLGLATLEDGKIVDRKLQWPEQA